MPCQLRGLSSLIFEPVGRPVGIVIGLHGNPMTPSAFEEVTSLGSAGAASGMIVVLPSAPRKTRRGHVWDVDADVATLAPAIEEVRAQYPSAAAKIIVCSISAGAQLACRLASQRPGLVTRIGAVGGLREPIGGEDFRGLGGCRFSRFS